MKEYVLHLLVISHVFAVPYLKTESEAQLENDLFSLETVIDVFQLALLCDASRLAVICRRMTSDNFKDVSSTEGWRVMKEAHPVLERQILEAVVDANAAAWWWFGNKTFHFELTEAKELVKKSNEGKMSIQLFEATGLCSLQEGSIVQKRQGKECKTQQKGRDEVEDIEIEDHLWVAIFFLN
ncbi:hypothetical protein Cgig2_010879 [Carnegiea gigantea]|uniref:Uncharacterized protein n=1 Tax=Carnegiea gigantea TaxID=171969 RepID=A0A9Q1GY87_9CARY|nr:hypothetical protein Cgig2_010879 [Carnegiea gigantea]